MFLKEDASDRGIDRVMKLSCLEQVLGSLPQGLETVIGERGYGLSEGQAQRVAIARAQIGRASCRERVLRLV